MRLINRNRFNGRVNSKTGKRRLKGNDVSEMYLFLLAEGSFPVISEVMNTILKIKDEQKELISVSLGEAKVFLGIVTEEMDTEPADFFSVQINRIYQHFEENETTESSAKLQALEQITRSQSLIIANISYPEDTIIDKETFMLLAKKLLEHFDGLLLSRQGCALLGKDMQIILSDQNTTTL